MIWPNGPGGVGSLHFAACLFLCIPLGWVYSIAQGGRRNGNHLQTMWQKSTKIYRLNWLPSFFQSFEVTVAILPLHSMTGPCQRTLQELWSFGVTRRWSQMLTTNTCAKLWAGAAFFCHFSMGGTLRLSWWYYCNFISFLLLACPAMCQARMHNTLTDVLSTSQQYVAHHGLVLCPGSRMSIYSSISMY